MKIKRIPFNSAARVTGLFLIAALSCAPTGSPTLPPGAGAGAINVAVPEGDKGAAGTLTSRQKAPERATPGQKIAAPGPSRADALRGVTLEGPGVTAVEGPVLLRSAKNEWVSYVLRVGPLAAAGMLDLDALKQPSGETLQPTQVRVYQVLPMPIDINRAGYVRHTGMAVAASALPRALLPLKCENNRVNLAQLRDPRQPTSAAAKAAGSGQETLLWVEMQIPPPAVAGAYAGQIRLTTGKTVSTLGVALTLYDFVLPDERRLLMVGRLEWPALVRLFPETFEVVRPNLLGRGSPNSTAAVQKLDQLIKLAQEHRTNLVVPRLQPTAKWPAGQPPVLDWKEFDATVGPWLDGTAFADRVPLGYWPLPKTDMLQNFPVPSRIQYYAAAAGHFDQANWLDRAPVVLEKPTAGRANMAERLSLSAEAQRVLDANPRLRLQFPLEPDQIVIDTNGNNPGAIDSTRTKRLNAAAPAIISASPLGNWPPDLDRPQTWLRTDLQGLIPYVGAGGNEGDVRVWAWLAFLRNARMITFEGGLPATSRPEEPADPNELAWFYPGEWFGVSEPLPTVQLKWLRRAEQDFEYLELARQRRSVLNLLPMARVITKPVEIQPNQAPDPTYALFTGTADAAAWTTLQDLLARTVLVRGPGQAADDATLSRLNVDTLQWIQPLEKPSVLPRTAGWTVGGPDANSPGPWVNLRLGIDVYNASDTTPDQNELAYTRPNAGWIVDPSPVSIPKLKTYQVARFGLGARVNPNEVESAKHVPVEIKFQSGFTGDQTPVKAMLPVSRVFRRVAVNVKIDGSLEDWTTDDAVQVGPLVKMLSRPEIQTHDLQYAATPSEIYSSWTDTALYVAFKLGGVQGSAGRGGGNEVDYQFRRAWGEDVCQILMQALYEDGTAGPLLHVAVKPSGIVWVERRLDPKLNAVPWQAFQATMSYKSTLEGPNWRGEIAIPWTAIMETAAKAPDAPPAGDPAADMPPARPVMIKFNFVQHKAATGESASWAGPLDFGRDENFMGVLVFKERE